MKSMTAFGCGTASSARAQVTVELTSLNRRYLEVSTYLPAEFERFESEIRLWIEKKIARGGIKVRLTVTYSSDTPVVVKPNVILASQIKQACDQLAQLIHLGDSSILVQEVLANRREVLQFEESLGNEEEYRELIEGALNQALEKLLRMKLDEGNALKDDIKSRLSTIHHLLEEITKRASNATDDYRQKLQERIEEYLPGALENEERILREVVLFAEKVDISEELTRMSSHMTQLENFINEEKSSIGKTVEFLFQELLREVNTIGSKSSNAEIVHRVVSIKTEIEKMKEQIKNVE